MATAATTPGPSQFAQLFKRSKFASFDPAIAQVYHSYGGYAHRGDFGLKRPLPPSARTKDNYIRVKEIDTPEQQTEWSYARNQGRWIKRWDEGGAGATAEPKTNWGNRGRVTKWETISSFDASPRSQEMSDDLPIAIPNIESMNDVQFGRYLRRLRKLRPEFRKYLLEEWQRTHDNIDGQAWVSSDLLRWMETDTIPAMDVTSRVLKDAHYNFIAQRAKPSDKTLIPCPHPNAGLSYTHANTLQTDRLYPPVPGRLLSTRPASDARSLFDTSLKTTVIAVGGTLADSVDHSTPGLLTSKQSLALSEVAYGRQEPKHGEISARIEKVSVIAPPNVVGKHGGLGGAQVNMVAREVNSPDIARPTRTFNPHPLGSMEYVGYTPDVPDTPAIDSPTWNPIAPVQGRKKAAVDRARDVLQGRLTALKKSAQRK